MEELISSVLPQMPLVGILLAVFWVLRSDVNTHLAYLEHLIEVLIETITKDDGD